MKHTKADYMNTRKPACKEEVNFVHCFLSSRNLITLICCSRMRMVTCTKWYSRVDMPWQILYSEQHKWYVRNLNTQLIFIKYKI